MTLLYVTSCQNRVVDSHVFIPMECDSIDFTIEGTVSNGADKVLFDERPYTETVSFPVSDGHFSFTVRQPLYKFLQIEDCNNGWMQIIVDSLPARVEVDFSTNTIVEGSWLNRQFNQYMLILDSLYDLMDLHTSDNDQTIYESLEQSLHNAEWHSVIDNLDNMIPVYTLSIGGQYCMMPYERLTECMKEQYAFTSHPEMEHVWKYYWEIQKRLPGQKYHDLELKDPEGNLHKLSEYVGHGNYVLLDFWASWCGPCMYSMPLIKELYESYSDLGLQIIGLSLDDNHDNWVNAIESNNLPWIQLSDLKGSKSVASDAYGISAIPETVLISPEGKILSIGLTDQKLKAKLEELIQ